MTFVTFSKMLKFTRFTSLLSRRFLTTPSDNVLEALNNRTLIRVSGPEVSTFLQGLITNDIEHLKSGPGSMYAMFLNNSGRILYDTIIYRHSEKNTYLIECDKQITSNLQKHLKLYRIRRKIDITSLDDELKVFVLFNSKMNETTPPVTFKTESDLLVFRDPRIASLGSRIIAKPDSKVSQNINSEGSYRRLRYTLGVGEGIEDLPPGDCFPLECNCDYLHGVSFHKGCYIGQELTARIHHTGMVRKRLMPLYFKRAPSKLPEEKIIHDTVNLGKLRGVEGDVGLALLRIAKALPVKEIKIGDGLGFTSKPNWWPVEAPKEKISRLQ